MHVVCRHQRRLVEYINIMPVFNSQPQHTNQFLIDLDTIARSSTLVCNQMLLMEWRSILLTVTTLLALPGSLQHVSSSKRSHTFWGAYFSSQFHRWSSLPAVHWGKRLVLQSCRLSIWSFVTPSPIESPSDHASSTRIYLQRNIMIPFQSIESHWISERVIAKGLDPRLSRSFDVRCPFVCTQVAIETPTQQILNCTMPSDQRRWLVPSYDTI